MVDGFPSTFWGGIVSNVFKPIGRVDVSHPAFIAAAVVILARLLRLVAPWMKEPRSSFAVEGRHIASREAAEVNLGVRARDNRERKTDVGRSRSSETYSDLFGFSYIPRCGR